MHSKRSNSKGVIVTSGFAANGLGVVRCFGRRGIPVLYIDSEGYSIVRYSKYIDQRLKCQSPRESDIEFVNILLKIGQQIDGKMVIIPTDDRYVLALSKHKQELEQFFFLPVPNSEIVQKLVNKKDFYKLLIEMQIPHPKTYFPEDITELGSMGREVDYPYIIKPAHTMPFREAFGKKCFVINSSEELDRAIKKLREKNLELVIQEIIPGKVVYEFYTYFNKKSEPLAICGWDKIRHYPPDFGSGSFCKSVWWSPAVEQGISFLKAIGYYGIAGVELIKDPRDGKYKMIEVNARTITQNRLAAACGVDIEYIAYLDARGQFRGDSVSPSDNVYWVEDFLDLVSCLVYLKRKEITMGEIVESLRVRKVHSIAAWDDPAPLIAYVMNLGFKSLNKPIKALRNRLFSTRERSGRLKKD
jgi:D-aspartate ligase